MKKITLFAVFSFCFSTLLAQTQTNIAGTYHTASNDLDADGHNWILLENNEFAIFTLGQIIAGKWSKDDHDIITFTPYASESPFGVYGRKNPKVKGTKIMFHNFNGDEIAYVGNSNDGIQPIVNKGAKCFTYPLLKEFDTYFRDIVLSLFPNEIGAKCFSYSDGAQQYNDFIIMYYPASIMTASFKANYKNGKLSFDSRTSSKKENAASKTTASIENYMVKWVNSHSLKSIVRDRLYNVISSLEDEKYQNFLETNFNFDPASQVYNAKNKDGRDNDSHDLNILFLYSKVELKQMDIYPAQKEESLFNLACSQ
ncbi:hypothetical protein GKZ90_0009105 [Flavobacterium sp. MC2016-06]|jgi:hypothetical protein|uniref:hypothetical protein n=1 Tax=Flavobacterium sp. MC2016-06 TaxID=2676308 RepID=UPI0012BA84B2|nr:hypothetical protein [Flavobacterium sp. MC2016-06]MBU3859378.1 hypothetical protein [Flavobacterium sp. MC2016-06]